MPGAECPTCSSDSREVNSADSGSVSASVPSRILDRSGRVAPNHDLIYLLHWDSMAERGTKVDGPSWPTLSGWRSASKERAETAPLISSFLATRFLQPTAFSTVENKLSAGADVHSLRWAYRRSTRPRCRSSSVAGRSIIIVRGVLNKILRVHQPSHSMSNWF